MIPHNGAMSKRVLVTGASRGIGRAIALKLAGAGWSVAVHYNNRGQEAGDVARALGSSCAGLYSADLSQPTSAAKLIAEVNADGPLDALVNNAGIYIHQDLIECSDEDFESVYSKVFAVNFESPLRLTREACKIFLRQGAGKVLNVASRVGFKGEAGAALYAASKAALINLTRSLAVELADRSIQCFAIAPGWVNTSMVRPDVEARLPEILSGLPLGRMASPEDCAAAASFLLSDEASYLSGIAIDINGASYFH